MNARTFALEIDKELDLSFDQWNQVVRKTALNALSRLTERTPVDKGRAKANWFVAIGSAGTETTEDEDPAPLGVRGLIAYNRGSSVIDGYKNQENFPVIALYNNLPYIEGLEDGRSNQALAGGIVAITVTELQVGL